MAVSHTHLDVYKRQAFTGGVNLADEYINQKERFGHWKDTAIMLKGDAVNSFLMMFLQIWNITEQKPEDYRKYQLDPGYQFPPELDRKGYVCLLYTSSASYDIKTLREDRHGWKRIGLMRRPVAGGEAHERASFLLAEEGS